MDVRTDQALILRRTPYGESSLVVQLLTRKHGRVHVLAKGAYRPTSRFYCVLDFFDTLDLEWSTHARAELGLLRQGSLYRRRRTITDDLVRYRSALGVVELAELAARRGQDESRLFGLTEDALDGLATGAAAAQLIGVVFELGFLQNLGLAPALEHCAACGGASPPIHGDRAAFSAGAGGRLCLAHAEEARASGRRVGTLPVSVLDAAATLARTTLPNPEIPALDPVLLERVRDLVGRFLGYHLETRPATHRRFLAAPNRNAPREGSPPPFPTRLAP